MDDPSVPLVKDEAALGLLPVGTTHVTLADTEAGMVPIRPNAGMFFEVTEGVFVPLARPTIKVERQYVAASDPLDVLRQQIQDNAAAEDAGKDRPHAIVTQARFQQVELDVLLAQASVALVIDRAQTRDGQTVTGWTVEDAEPGPLRAAVQAFFGVLRPNTWQQTIARIVVEASGRRIA